MGEKFALIADYLSRSDSSISRYVPCLKFTESTSIPQTEQEKEECNELRKAAEFQYRSEECWRSYLTQVRHCRYSNNPGACAASFSGLEANVHCMVLKHILQSKQFSTKNKNLISY